MGARKRFLLRIRKARGRLLAIAGSALFLTGCEFLPKRNPGPAVSPSPTPVARAATESSPVWVQPTFSTAYVQPYVDKKSGNWVGGHYTATVVEDGHWASREEAELMGKPFLIPDSSSPVVPMPNTGQELNATTLQQQLAKLERGPSQTSLSNQLPPGTVLTPRSQPLSLPGLDPSPTPRRTLGPSARYNSETEDLELGAGGVAGTTYSIPTPKGTAVVIYSEGSVSVTLNRRSLSAPLDAQGRATVSLKGL